MKPRVLILTGVGINSNRELAEAFSLAGAEAEEQHISTITHNPKSLLDYQLIAFPGGFSYGDHISSGKILANLLKSKCGDSLQLLKEKSVPMLGICNGFQILIKLGLLPQMEGRIQPEASLVHNDSGKYEDRWVELGITEDARDKSPWFKGLDRLECPVRHGEGKLVLPEASDLKKLQQSGLIALKYQKDGEAADSIYPFNPNGSWDDIAGLIDPTGLILGLMPHPEVAIHSTQRPDWTRRQPKEPHTDCLKLFKNITRHIIES